MAPISMHNNDKDWASPRGGDAVVKGDSGTASTDASSQLSPHVGGAVEAPPLLPSRVEIVVDLDDDPDREDDDDFQDYADVEYDDDDDQGSDDCSVGSISVAALSAAAHSQSSSHDGSGSGVSSLASPRPLQSIDLGGGDGGMVDVDLSKPSSSSSSSRSRRKNGQHRRRHRRPRMTKQPSSLYGVDEERLLEDVQEEEMMCGGGLGGGLVSEEMVNLHGSLDRPIEDYDYHNAADAVLDDAALRFAPRGERSHAAQVQALEPNERECFESLKERWASTAKEGNYALPDEMVLRFARCSPGRGGPFDADSAWTVMNSYDRRYLDLTVSDVEDRLRTRTFLVVPGLKTCDGRDVLYMKPGNYPAAEEFAARLAASDGDAPPVSSSSSVRGGGSTYASSASVSSEPAVDGLVYCVDALLQCERNATEGVAVFADMSGWDYSSHFSFPYFHQLVLMLQGRIPVRITQFLVLNPPGWFRRAWGFVRPVLKEELREKVILVEGGGDGADATLDGLDRHMTRNYREFLPDDTEGGRANGEALVEDFIRYRKHVEGVL